MHEDTIRNRLITAGILYVGPGAVSMDHATWNAVAEAAGLEKIGD